MNTQVGEILNSLVEICIDLSRWHGILGTELSHDTSSQRKSSKSKRKNRVGKHNIDSFEHFLEERFDWGGKEFYWHRAIRGWFPAVDHVCDTSGTLVCDMMRFEHLNDDLCAYFDVDEMSRARNVTDLNKGSYKDLYN